MKKLLRIAAVTAAVAGFAAPGLASAATATVSTEGPNSKAKVNVVNKNDLYSNVKNNVNFANKNKQGATTGNAKAANNTTVGNVGTGAAMVDNHADITLAVDNSNANGLCGCGSDADVSADVSTQGPNSPAYVNVKNENKVVTKVTNNVNVSNSNYQTAKSGSASAYNNTTVGDVTTGDASASNEAVVNLSITN